MSGDGSDVSFTIDARWHGRRTPIYLASFTDHTVGLEEHDAFHTLADAKRWCAQAVDRHRLPWEERADAEGRVYAWLAGIDGTA